MDGALYYIGATLLYVMVIHFAMGIRKEFDVGLMITVFVIGFFIGVYLRALEAGFVFAVVTTLLLYGHTNSS
jgi:hypothetical protein